MEATSLQSNSPGTAQVDRAALHISAVAFTHRFGPSLNGHVHCHVCALDEVFEEIPGVGDTDVQSSPTGIVFRQANAVDEIAVAEVQATLKNRILRAFVGRGLLQSCDAKDMLAYQHRGFSMDPSVCIEARNRAALVPSPRTHRHRNFGVLAPNSPVRAAVTALAQPPTRQTEPAITGGGVPGVVPLGHPISPTPEPAPPKRAPAHYPRAMLIAGIYEVFPLLCPKCGGQMHLIAFITEGSQIKRILDYIGADSEPPHISPARGQPLWDDCDAHVIEGVAAEPSRAGLGSGWASGPRGRGRSAYQLVTGQNGDSDSLPGSHGPVIPAAPLIPLMN